MAQQNTLDQKLDLYSQQNRTHPQRKKVDASTLLGYSIAASMAMIAPDAMAAIVYNGNGFSVSISANTAESSVSGAFSWNIDSNGPVDFNVNVFANLVGSFGDTGRAGFGFSALTPYGIVSYFGGAKNFSPSNSVQLPGTAGTSYLVSQAGGSVTVHTSTNTNPAISSGHVYGNFSLGSIGYVGLRFAGTTGTPGPQFAWARIRFEASGDVVTGPVISRLVILDWAYDDSGAPIHVESGSPVPLPGAAGLMLLGMGSFGLTALRRRKQQYLERQQAKTETA